MTIYPQMGDLFKFWGPIVFFEREKLHNSNLVCRLILTSTTARMTDYPFPKGMC